MTRSIVLGVVALLCAGRAHPQQLVSFPTDDGGVVFAHLSGGGPHGVVLAHGGQFDKESWAEQAASMVHAGLRVLAIDFRGRGRSHGGTEAGAADSVHLDVLAAVRYLRSTGAQRVAVVGASFGGGAAAQAAVAAPGEIDRLLLLAHSPIAEPAQMGSRTLFIVAREDTSGSGARRLPHIRRQYELAPQPKELIVLEGAAHAQFLFQTDQRERLMREILRFLTDP